MSYTIRYTGTREQRRKAAFADAVDYLGQDGITKVWALVGEILSAKDASMRVRVNQCYFALSFAGLRGAPAWAIIRTRWICFKSGN